MARSRRDGGFSAKRRTGAMRPDRGAGEPRGGGARRARDRGKVAADTGPGLRVQKVLASIGLASRRQIDALVAEGKVRINGEVAAPGARVVRSDRVMVDGRRISLADAFSDRVRVLAYHKPVGVVCTRSDPEGRRTMFADLPRSRRWVSVGRLDINSSGLMLITDSGDLANRLMHPRFGVEREYLVRVRGALGPDAMAALEAGPELDGEPTHVESVSVVRDQKSVSADEANDGPGHAWYRIVLKEGRNREVRRLFEAVGHPVVRLKRIRYAQITLPRGLGPGRFRELEPAEVAALTEPAPKARPAAEVNATGRAKPADRANAAAGAKPATRARPATSRKPAARAKSKTGEKPVARAKPAARSKSTLTINPARREKSAPARTPRRAKKRVDD